MDQQQREYFLHQQMKTIQEELGGISYDEEIEEMAERAKEKQWSDKVADHFEKELAKLQRMNPQVAEYSIQRNYLDLFLDLPWEHYSEDKFDLKRAQRILDRDHYGLEDVKQRIIEYLAVLKLRKDMKSPILCLYGPPGVGKTSLGMNIAEHVALPKQGKAAATPSRPSAPDAANDPKAKPRTRQNKGPALNLNAGLFVVAITRPSR